MIGYPKKLVNPNYRKFYIVENNIVIGYKKIPSLDTIHVNITLKKESLFRLISNYKNEWTSRHLGNGYYQYYLKREGVTLTTFPLTSTLVICQLQIQNKLLDFNQLVEIYKKVLPNTPNLLLSEDVIDDKHEINNNSSEEFQCTHVIMLSKEECLQVYNSNQSIELIVDVFSMLLKGDCVSYYIRRLDFAFDYLIPFSKSIFMNTNLNQKREVFKSYYYIGSSNNFYRKELLSHYDTSYKNDKKEYKNRAEVKYFFNTNNGFKLDSIDHNIIKSRLEKKYFFTRLLD